MFDPLVSVDPSGRNDVPILAERVPTLENGDISKDGLTIVYHLRKNVKWQDGAPFTSADVKFSWQAILNPNNNVISQTGYALVRTVDTPDPYTAIFRMKQRFSPAIDTIFGESDDPFEIIPVHLLGKLHDINNAPFNAAPIGTGPFQLKEWVRGDHMTLVPNPNYFLGKPKLRQIVIRFIPDENTELSALRTHDLDWQFEASPDQYDQLRSLPGVKLILQNKNEYERIEFNVAHPPLDDVRVRRAIAYGVDKQRLVEDLTFGSAVVADQDLPPFMWAHENGVTSYPFNIAKARALMRSAGYVLGSDGYFEKDGKRLTLTLVTNISNVTRRAAVVQVQAMLRRVGIDVQPKYYLGSLLFATVGQGGILQTGKFDLSWNGWVAGIDPDNSSTFTCAAQPPHGNNTMRYCDASVDRAEGSALDRFARADRTRAYATMETRVALDQPQISVWWPRMIQPINPDFKNFAPNPVTESWNAYQWEI